MIEFVDRTGILDPVGAASEAVGATLSSTGPSVRHLRGLLSSSAGGPEASCRMCSRRGQQRRRGFSHVAMLDELEKDDTGPEHNLVLAAEGGGSDRVMVSPTSEVFAEIVELGTTAQTLHLIADSFDEFLERLVPDDGFPDRPRDIARLRPRWVSRGSDSSNPTS